MYSFEKVCANSNNKNWQNLISREKALYGKTDDVRNEFARDYTRILHSLAYRRLKHKTQVFYNIENDHICTRMEHVAHVESVSYTIATALGLNTDLTKAISIGHDLGHAPFGHKGENMIREISKKYLNKNFWHEQNGLRFVEGIELLEDETMHFQNLDLTYAVRDGIISHCGEIDSNCLRPRDEFIDFADFDSPGKYEAYTWEGCVVKLADKIAYVGRDIEDAKRLGFLEPADLKQLEDFAKRFKSDAVNTTVIIHSLVSDVCRNSSPEKGICLSNTYAGYLEEIKRFNLEKIYNNPRLKHFEEYAKLVINSIFNTLLQGYNGANSFDELEKMERYYPNLAKDFSRWLVKYCNTQVIPENQKNKALLYENKKIYSNLETKEIYVQAIIDFISGMTDGYAIKLFNELITF